MQLAADQLALAVRGLDGLLRAPGDGRGGSRARPGWRGARRGGRRGADDRAGRAGSPPRRPARRPSLLWRASEDEPRPRGRVRHLGRGGVRSPLGRPGRARLRRVPPAGTDRRRVARERAARRAAGRRAAARLQGGCRARACSRRSPTFALRAAQALLAGSRARDEALELERTRTLLSVAAQATAQLSLAHTLSIAVERDRCAARRRARRRLPPRRRRQARGGRGTHPRRSARASSPRRCSSMLLGPLPRPRDRRRRGRRSRAGTGERARRGGRGGDRGGARAAARRARRGRSGCSPCIPSPVAARPRTSRRCSPRSRRSSPSPSRTRVLHEQREAAWQRSGERARRPSARRPAACARSTKSRSRSRRASRSRRRSRRSRGTRWSCSTSTRQ